MIPILGCSVISVTIIIERFIQFRRAKVDNPGFSSQLKVLLEGSRYEEAAVLVRNTSGPLARVIEVALENRDRPEGEREEKIGLAGSREVRALEKNLRGLAIIGNVAPLLGLLGTVTGMIKVFIKIQELSGAVDPGTLAGGIWEALITTAAGLSVAIPTLVLYHYFEGRVDEISAQMREKIEELKGFL